MTFSLSQHRDKHHTHTQSQKGFMPGLLSVQVEALFHFDFFSSLDFGSFHTLLKKKKITFNTYKCWIYKA